MRPPLLLGLVALLLMASACVPLGVGLAGWAGWAFVLLLGLLVILPIGLLEWAAVTRILEALSSPLIIVAAVVAFLYLVRRR